MFTNNRHFLRMCLAFSVILFFKTSQASKDSSIINVYNPKTECELIDNLSAANNNSPAVVNLGGLAFEFTDNCFNAATNTCGHTPAEAEVICYADGADFSHGPTALPEITANISVLNGRIVRAIDALSSFRIFTVTTGAGNPGNLSIFKVTLENGDAESFTPILPESIENTVLVADTGNGGAVYVDQNTSFSVHTSKIAFNKAEDNGGGIYVAAGGSLSAQTSIISHNVASVSTTLNGGGGGIFLAGVITSLSNSSVSHNRVYGMGGGLNNQGSAKLINSTFSYNLTCFPLSGSGECEVNNNPTGVGGGIYNDASALLLEINQSTFWGNRSYRGGALYNESANEVNLNNNTIAGNYSAMNGGGIYNSPTTSALISIFVSNLVAGNIDQDINPSPDIYNISPASINTPPFSSTPPVAPIIEGFNLVGDCGTDAFFNPQCGLTNGANFDIIGGSANLGDNIDPRLKNLAQNGGPTPTVALDPESPALNNGFNNLGLAFDQRGQSFFRTVAQTDIGAYEDQYDLGSSEKLFR